MKPAVIKKHLERIIDLLNDNPSPYLYHPDRDFTRNRKSRFDSIVKIIVKMDSGSLSREILKWFDYGEDTVSVSAFIQLFYLFLYFKIGYHFLFTCICILQLLISL